MKKVIRKPAATSGSGKNAGTGSSRDSGRTRGKGAIDDRKLWDHVASTVEPVFLKGRVTEPPSGLSTPPNIQPTKEKRIIVSPADTKRPEKSARPAMRKSVSPKSASPQKAPAPANVLERRQTRKLAKGRKEIDGRIDLHGMRQWEAHAALRDFLARSGASGHRTVLVITGKGRRDGSGSDSEILSERREHGVLRRIVPEWLGSDPDISPLVSGIAPAGPRHGGDGAVYVMLKARKPQKPRSGT